MKSNLKSAVSLFVLLIAVSISTTLTAQNDNILSVDAMDFGAGIVVMWETVDVPDNDETFIIERATENSTDFTKVGELEASTMEGRSQFTFEDRELGLKKAFYRIKTVQSNAGVESYSEVIPIVKDVLNNFMIQETEKIADHQYRVSVVSVVDGELKFQLATNMGDIVNKQSYTMVKGENDFMVDLEVEADGSYVASFQNGSYTITKNFSKQTSKEDNVARKD